MESWKRKLLPSRLLPLEVPCSSLVKPRSASRLFTSSRKREGGLRKFAIDHRIRAQLDGPEARNVLVFCSVIKRAPFAAGTRAVAGKAKVDGN